MTADAIAVLVGRVLIAALFLAGAVQKGIDPASAGALLTGRGLPAALVWPAALFNLGAGLAILTGIALRPAALATATYCALTAFFHLIPEDPWQMSIFVKNWAVAGGCLILAAHGPGPLRLHLGAGRLGSCRERRPGR